MIKTYLININKIELEISSFYNEISFFFQNKILEAKSNFDKKLFLLEALLINYGLKEYNLKEKNMQYTINNYGKLYFKGFSDLFFNISHSQDYLIVSLGKSEMGSDIQFVKSLDDTIKKKLLSKKELDSIFNGKENVDNEFIKLWVKKESYLKCIGTGINKHPSSIIIDENYIYGEFTFDNYKLCICTKNNNEIFEFIFINKLIA